MSIHWPRQKEGSVMWCVEVITEDVNGGDTFDVVLCAEVGSQKATKLHQCVMTLQKTEISKFRNLQFLLLQKVLN